jgi:hypothetical protein
MAAAWGPRISSRPIEIRTIGSGVGPARRGRAGDGVAARSGRVIAARSGRVVGAGWEVGRTDAMTDGSTERRGAVSGALTAGRGSDEPTSGGATTGVTGTARGTGRAGSTEVGDAAVIGCDATLSLLGMGLRAVAAAGSAGGDGAGGGAGGAATTGCAVTGVTGSAPSRSMAGIVACESGSGLGSRSGSGNRS